MMSPESDNKCACSIVDKECDLNSRRLLFESVKVENRIYAVQLPFGPHLVSSFLLRRSASVWFAFVSKSTNKFQI